MFQDFAAGLELHDFGKVGIPDNILKKPASLTDEELKVMRTHPEIGYDILSMHDDLKEIAKLAVPPFSSLTMRIGSMIMPISSSSTINVSIS